MVVAIVHVDVSEWEIWRLFSKTTDEDYAVEEVREISEEVRRDTTVELPLAKNERPDFAFFSIYQVYPLAILPRGYRRFSTRVPQAQGFSFYSHLGQ